ncbi:NAD(P)-binding protein [Daedalea quercina L-15889]|uniref:NAD(P)-binding protein n=1 Tax=Daedalea quercina L-15889 TaxID=1314783 RepID=A0A165TLT0_9APHY|nr:NAD(P)-binding protein [Daedalea quercina L-15889]
MPSSNLKPLVLVIGATGTTGRSIVHGLLESGNFNVAALTRPTPVPTPAVNALRERGVEIRVADYTSDPVPNLKEVLAGVDILISAINASALEVQKPIIAAAVEAGVRRIIPCDFGTPGARGVRVLHDSKLDIRDYVKELCSKSSTAKYTFIDVGWWMVILPPSTAARESVIGPLSHRIYGAGDKKFVVTKTENIGTYVARIIADPRTENAYVIAWDDELTLAEVHELAESASGEGEALKAKRVVISREQLEEQAGQGKAMYAQDPSDMAKMLWAGSEYMISMHLLGEDSLENAKALGALDVRELYPDIQPTRFKDFVKEYYKV